MTVKLKYMSQLKAALGTSQEEIEIATPCTLDQLLSGLVEKHGDNLKPLLFDREGNFQRSLLICLGDQQLPVGDATPVNDGDEVTLIVPISGG